MNGKTDENEEKVRCSFELSKEEAQRLCDLRCEPKPSTAAAQVVRLAIKCNSMSVNEAKEAERQERELKEIFS